MFHNPHIRNFLSRQKPALFAVYAIAASFLTYASMYAFRKPISVATFSGWQIWGVDYKIILIFSQIIGYTLSKFIGIDLVSSLEHRKRPYAILILIAIAELSLILFAYTPHSWNFIFLFFNGLPLGMVWGLVFSFLEGRKQTELLAAGLSTSFIVSSGFVKSIGAILIQSWGISELEMPYLTGALVALPLIFFVWLLSHLPEPNPEDEKLRFERIPMSGKDRWNFFRTISFGLIVLTLIYMMLTTIRDLRDNFMADIWKELNYTSNPMIFTYTELPIAFGVLILVAFMIWIKNNFTAFMINHLFILFGALMVGIATVLFQSKIILPEIWMVLVGLGLYMGYVPFNAVLFERLIAVFRKPGNATFFIYVADSFGYLSSVGVLFYKNFAETQISWLNFFIKISYTTALIGGTLTVISLIYFFIKKRHLSKQLQPLP